MAQYQVLFDEAFLIQSLQRYRRQHRARLVGIAIKLIASAFLVGFAAFTAMHGSWVPAMVLVALVIFLFNSHFIDLWLFKRRLRESPYRNERMLITLDSDGFHAVGSKSDSRLRWAAFTKARAFTDGFLLFQGPNLLNWLPDAARTEGTRLEVESLIIANVEDYRTVGQGN